jgi:hypothetical protein
MAKMIEDVLVIKLSKLVKDSESSENIVTEDIHAALEQVAQELVGNGVLVEVERA